LPFLLPDPIFLITSEAKGKVIEMGKEMKECLNRLELADYLQSLSDQLRQGSLEFGDRQWIVPEEIWNEIKLKEKKGYIKAKISLSWPTEQDYDQEAKKELAEWKESIKEVKKRLTDSYKKVLQAAEQGQFPDQQSMDEFVKSSEDFGKIADPDWQEAMKFYLDHLANLQRAVGNQDRETMLHELRDLEICMIDCHRDFKYYPEKLAKVKQGSQ
jgi:XXXCH domain-containing protein